MSTDLFGHPVVDPVLPSPKPQLSIDEQLQVLSTRKHRNEYLQSRYARIISSDNKARRLIEKLNNGSNKLLFADIAGFLSKPIIKFRGKKKQRPEVELLSEDFDEDETRDVSIPYAPWGEPWIVDKNGLSWSFEAVHFLQHIVFWESVEILGMAKCEEWKWNVLKWIFEPAYRHRYIFDKRINRSHKLEWHERDETFSFHNTAIAARVDPEELRELLRRELAPEVIKAICDYHWIV